MTEKNEKNNKSFNSSDDNENSKENKQEIIMIEKPQPVPSQKPKEKKIKIKEKEMENMLKLINTTSYKKPKNNSYNNIIIDNFEPKKLYSNKNTKIEKASLKTERFIF